MSAPSLSAPVADEVASAILAHGALRVPARDIAALRQQPLPHPTARLSTSFLKHADEQTVVGLVAVGQALERLDRDIASVRGWGVLGAPRFLGRFALAEALRRFADEGAWGISPHLIPHRSLHALSGTVSQALGIQGPNFGVGGGPDAGTEVFTVAAALLADGCLPGLWIIMTGFEPELTPQFSTSTSDAPTEPVCSAVALALVPPPPHHSGRTLRIGGLCRRSSPTPAGQAVFRWESLIDVLTTQPLLPATRWQLSNGGWVAVELAERRVGIAHPAVESAEGSMRNCA